MHKLSDHPGFTLFTNVKAEQDWAPGRAPAGSSHADNKLTMAEFEIHRLKAAIRTHRDYKGQDRCKVDDVELYGVLPEGAQGYDAPRDDRDAWMAGCGRYYDNRVASALAQMPGTD